MSTGSRRQARAHHHPRATEHDFQEWARLPGNIWWQVEEFKHQGNAIINQDPGGAIQFYSMALGIDDDPNHPFNLLTPRERATLYSNRCTAWTKIRNLGQAFEDAMACISVDPTFQKGYWRAATVMKQMNKEDEALEALIDGYPKILGSDREAVNFRVNFIYEITTLTVRLWDKWKKSQFLFRLLDIPTSVWTEVVQRLAKNKDYHALRLVFLRGGIQSGKTYEIGKGGAATGCDTSAIDLRTIVRDLFNIYDNWSMHLVLELLKHGSKVEGLSQKEGDTPLHCAVENTLRTGWVGLLEYLLSKVFTTSERRNLPDRFGDSLFHLVAKTTGPFSHAKTVVDILRKHVVDPSRKDRRGYMPLDVVPMSSPHYTEIRRLLTETAVAWEQFMRQQRNEQQFQQHSRSMPGQRFPGPRFSPPNAAFPGNQTRPSQTRYYPTRPQAKPQPSPPPSPQFFDPSRIFNTPSRPSAPAPFFDHSKLFAEPQKPTWQQEEMVKQKQREEQQKKERLKQERLRKEEERKKQEELEARRQQQLEEQRRREIEEQIRARLMMEEQRKREDERRRLQEEQKREEERRRLQEEKRQKEKERQEKLRQKQEEKKRKENQKRKERKELQRKKEAEAKLSTYQKGLMFQKQGKHDQAVPLFLEFIGKEHRNQVIYRDVDRCKDALVESLEHCQEIPDSVKCEAPPTYWNTTVQELADKNKWWSLFLLLVGGSYSINRNSMGIAHGCDASGVSIMAFLNQWEGMNMAPGRLTMVKALLENKAKPDGLLNDSITPLAHCLKTENYELVNLLLTHGASPKLLVMDPGDTPFHSALKIGFKQDDRKFAILDLLLTKYSADPTAATYLDKNARDRAGNTLFHLALTGGSKNQSLNAVKILSQHKVNPWLRDHGGRVPLRMVTNKDRRYMYLAEAAKYYDAASESIPSVPRGDNQGSSSDGIRVSGVPNNWSERDRESGQEGRQQPTTARPTERMPQREKLRRELEQLLGALPMYVPQQAELEDTVETHGEPLTSPPRISSRQKEPEEILKQGVEDEGEKIDEADEEMEDEEDEDEEMEAIDATIFDDLTWEVECTAKVWKFLHDRQVPHKLKETAIRKIQMLGSGDWRGRLCKPLEGQPKQHNMKLYEARLTKGGRILWEVAIAFSPRCSEESEKRLGSGDGTSEDTAVAGGRVYSEIIRIWDIFTDHNKLSHAIDVIVKSVERGEECIIRKNLVGISKKSTTGVIMTLRLPTYFREITGNSPDRNSRPVDNAKKIPQPYFPPASSRENEYHIMKFYSVNSTLVNAMLNDNDVKVDFPFRVTELEHAIINLQPRPASSILLLGRSGTGKTTCCLYRMWTKFFKYWQQVSMTGEPLIPRDIAFIHQDKPDEDQDESDSETDSSSASNKPSRADVRMDFRRDSCNSKSVESSGTGPFNDEGDTNMEMIMDHLHQIFVTKNAVLCSEVQRNFCNMSHACEFAHDPLAQQDTPIPHRFQDAHQARFPLFLSSRQFLLILDASLPNSYFPRDADGSLKRKIRGWDEEDGPLTFIPLIDEEDDEEEGLAPAVPDEDTTQEGALTDNTNPHGQHEAQGPAAAQKARYDPRREVTYEVFAFELWPRINKKKLPYHSTLVWMEITSFIKGSVEALHTDSGYLSLDSYLALGQKRASNFTADREEIYSLFKTYEHVKSQKNLFDEGDLVFHVYRRLRDVRTLDWVLHEIYVDETQDFTQAELALFIRCSHDPNSLFLTGDTAQSIMRGVAFRFDDLKSLFHYASKSVKALGKHSAVTVPKRVYQLTHNYRSHAGILNLASTIVDLMTHFFPNSFDRLERDQGLFHGPSPVLLESCSFSDLALLLCGNKRKTSEIEFGAHQVILVANEEAIEKLPAELRLGLVMTIYEAKGLEFDDVLLYNFFKDSPADKEWRVITDYLNELIAQQQNRSKELQDEGLKEIDVESLTATIRPRPLKFNRDEHKVLNSELKYLYTAITRARVNVWIFDEDETKRGPMFELFRCLKLVKGIGPDTKQDVESPDLDAMFVEKSSSWEWIQRGHYFFENKLWKVAAECYQRGGDEKRELLARAHHQAMEAERMRDQLHAMREKFLQAASLFLKCGSSRMAVNCLYNAREFALLAQLLEKQGEFSKAAKIYEKRLNRVSDACRCLELMKDYAKALDLLCSVGLHTKALDVIDRFKRFEQELKKKGKPLPKHVKRPGSTHTLSELIFKSAEYHFKNGDSGQMLDALEQLDHFEARVDFLRKRGLFAEAVKMLKDGGRLLDAAKILREQGKLEEACTILESSNHPEFVAECRLGQARKLLLEPGSAEDQTAAISLLTKAESLFTRCGDSVRKAETQLLLGQLKKDAAKIREANIAFNRMSHTAGESECTDHLIKLSLPSATSIKGRVFQQLKNLLELICALFVGTSPEQERQRRLCEEFFGLAPGEEGMLCIQRCEGARVLSALDKSLLQVSYIKAEKAREAIARCCLIPRALWWVKGARELLRGEMQKLTQCSDYVIGIPCSKPADTCQQLHEPYKFHHVEGRVSCLVQLIEIDSILEKASKLSNFKSADKLVAEIKRSQGKSAKKCKALYDVFFPEHCHQRFIGETASAMQKFLRLVRHTAVEKQLKAFAESERKEVDARRLRTDTDLYLMCHNIYLLIGEKPTVMENLVKQEEVDCLNWQKKDRWKHPQPLGMHPLFNNDPRKGFLSYKRRHLDSFASLYKNRDALESLSSFNRFMGTLANKPVDPLLPSISNTVALIEAKVTMMLALGAKIQQCSVAIPASYLAQAGFLDAICCPGQGHAMYSAVSNSAVNKDTRGQTCRLVSLICGTTRSGRDFNVLADAFSSVEYIHTGEAERTLVLVLVMLCNAGLALPAQIIRDTREALQSIAPSEEHLPKRVHTALCNVNKAQSRRNALQILEKLLAARDDEYLRECTWSPHMPRRGAPGLEFHKLKIKNFDDVHFETLRSKSPTVFTELAEGNVHQRGRDFEDKDEDVAREGEGSGDNSEEEGELRLEVSSEEAAKIQQEQETLQKERAAKIIRRVLKANRLLRLAALLRSCAYITLTVKPEVEAKSETTAAGWVSQQLVEFQHIPTGCTICNVRLREVQEVRPEPRDAAEEVQDGDDAAGEDDSVETDQEPEPEADSKDDLPTQEEHESTEFHKQRHQEFLQYGYMLRDEVYPLITDVDKLLKELRFPSLTGENPGDSGQFKYFEEDLSRRRQDLASKMTEIQNQRAFEKLADVRHAVDQLKKGFENSKRKLEQQRAAEHQDKTVDSDTEEADKMPFEEGEDADEDKILPVAEQPTRRKGGRNKGRGQKQKGRWNGRMGKRK
ncbi:TPR and ankyrin repeat-containing protein 1-like [Acanthaster planci]|uniref:TPR and ankyrin repeat-containing protein 1-like n=1 Tax=Acanthaster planci TaxID=133434 RepID=A0A8B7YYJ8_ACAPL|nr:TPR and ankyrin repeat-containing protein 1-like [Acanthaster planci]